MEVIIRIKIKLIKNIENGFNKYFQFFSITTIDKKINTIIEINKSGRNGPLSIASGNPKRRISEK
tara:strand:+ start:184 stop:378 length:195 start_codon:yes stop_codon:yes gene_type:complete